MKNIDISLVKILNESPVIIFSKRSIRNKTFINRTDIDNIVDHLYRKNYIPNTNGPAVEEYFIGIIPEDLCYEITQIFGFLGIDLYPKGKRDPRIFIDEIGSISSIRFVCSNSNICFFGNR